MSRVAVVTGANQGLGFALVEALAQRLDAGDVVYLTGRDPQRVSEAATRVTCPRAEVRAEPLDVRDGDGVRAFVDALAARHDGADVVFSNAAARLVPGPPSAALVRELVDTNNLGTTRVLRAFAPLMRAGGRLVVVASDYGSLRRLPDHLHGRFDTGAMTLDDVDRAVVAWRDAVLGGRAAGEGWPEWINIPSKVAQVAAVRVAARDANGTFVAAVSPGLVDTGASRALFADMSEAQTPADAAAKLLELALGPPRRDLHGQLVQFGRVVPWR
jgi:carbonyl reductase 1